MYRFDIIASILFPSIAVFNVTKNRGLELRK
jgi:hypothetical protein